MKITITLDQIIAWEPCERYVENGNALLLRLAGGRTEWELEEILRRDDIPPEDRVWLATRDGVLPPPVRDEWMECVVTRAVRRHALGTCISDWAWKWLSGEDRSKESAEAACTEARTAGAWAAAMAAETAAAWLAARAAVVAAAAAAALAARAEAALAANAAKNQEHELQIAELLEIIERNET